MPLLRRDLLVKCPGKDRRAVFGGTYYFYHTPRVISVLKSIT